jgi:hypothetical protein
MMGDQASAALVPRMGVLDTPVPGLGDEALGDCLGPNGLRRVMRGSGAAVAGVANHLDAADLIVVKTPA